ncbi:hypothetical protein [Nocardia sp. NPDC004722]
MPSTDELRIKLVAAISDVIGPERGRQLQWAEETGIDAANISRLARQEDRTFSLRWLINASPQFGLTPTMHITGIPKAAMDPGATPRTGIDATSDGADSDRFSQTLATILGRCIEAALDGTLDGKTRSQRDLADEVNLPQSTIWKLKTHRLETMKLDSIIGHAAKLGVDVDITTSPATQTA